MVIKPADSETERICKDGVWEVVLSSSSSVQVVESSSSEIINIPVPVNSSANENFSSIGEESSSSILSPGETTESSSSETEIIEQPSSSSEEFIESSSSEETKLYLCEDGETYVLDPANCEKVSSSSVIVVSSSSDNKPISSSSDVQESSSSTKSSSSVTESSSSTIDSSSAEESSSSVLNSVYNASENTLTDLRDGQVYKTVTIGARIWMSENLNYLPNDTVGTIWAGKTLCGGGAWKTKTEGDCKTFGRLYEEDFASITNYTQAICPDGWSLPTKAQYQEFISSLGDDAANKMRIDNSVYWDVDDATNQSGFSAVPSGYYSLAKGFNPIYEQNTPVVALFFDRKSQTGNSTIMIVDNTINYMQFGDKQFAAIRCIKN
jgi:uncharacterized protein (TIGR02145 family)